MSWGRFQNHPAKMRHHGKLNGELKGTIEGDDFAAALLRVWLGIKPPTEDLKKICWAPADRSFRPGTSAAEDHEGRGPGRPPERLGIATQFP